jgi:hypothetical protein
MTGALSGPRRSERAPAISAVRAFTNIARNTRAERRLAMRAIEDAQLVRIDADNPPRRAA